MMYFKFGYAGILLGAVWAGPEVLAGAAALHCERARLHGLQLRMGLSKPGWQCRQEPHSRTSSLRSGV